MMASVGLVGLGRHMNSRLFASLIEAQLGHVVFAYDIDAGTQIAFSRAKRVDSMVGTLCENAARVRSIISALPPTESTEVLALGVSANLPIYLEKPGLRSVADYEAALKTPGFSPRDVSLGFNFRFSPAMLAVRNALLNAHDPVFGTVRFLSRYPDGPEWGSPTAFEAWVRNNGVHAFDLLRSLLGEPSDIQSTGVSWTSNRFSATATFRWANGSDVRLEFGNATGTFQISADLQVGADHRILTDGLARCAVVNLETGLESEVYRQGGDSSHLTYGYVGSLREFLSRKRSTTLIGANFLDGLAAMKIAERLLSSARVAHVPLIPETPRVRSQ